jgi:hypothetical protein
MRIELSSSQNNQHSTSQFQQPLLLQTSTSISLLVSHTTTVIMAISESQLNEEIALLTNEAKEMAKDLSSPTTITNLSSPQPPRWLSLTPYKEVPENWEWDNEVELEDSLVLPSPKLSSSLHSLACRCQLCHVKQSEEEAGWGSGSEDSLSPTEKANCRILGVLKCYVYNLEHGTLITGSKVDERIEAALKRWVRCGKADVPCSVEHSEGVVLNEVKENWDISDEERVVVEIDVYGKRLMDMQGEIPDEVLEAANEILEWARIKGTADGREMDITSPHASLEIIEC